MTVDTARSFDATSDSIDRKVIPMNGHPQVNAFVQAAECMRENRYWARNVQEQLEFLGALRDVMIEVCFHLDRNHVLDPRGLAAFAASDGTQQIASWVAPSAESVLLPWLDAAIQRSLAVVDSKDNTGEDPTV